MSDEYDVIVIGAGPVGENAAQYAVRGTDRTACLVERELVGGECSFFACIPSTALAVWLEVAFNVSLLTQLFVTGPFMLLTCIPPLRPLKGWLVASQYFYKAEEGKLVRRQAGT